MSVYKRTQIYLAEDMLRELKLRADEENCTVSDVIRKAIQAFLQREREKNWDRDPLWDMVGSVAAEDGNLSTHHDRFLYGKEP